jgi:diguanylate cyclase (GGDEF) domain
MECAIDPKPAHRTWLLEEAIDNLPLGLIVFDNKREVVFCNKRYTEIYGLSSEQVKPGTPTSELIQHRLNLGLKVLSKPDDYIRERVEGAVVPGKTVHEFTDGRIIAYTVYPMPDGGGMATHEDITGREELSTRLKMLYELGKQQEENLGIRNLQFDTAINNMSQGLCFFDAAQRLIVCNDRYVEMYGLSPDRVAPGTPLAEIVDMRFEASFPAMSRDEYLQWRANIAVSAKPTESIVELRNGRTFKIRHRPMPDLGWVATHEDITEQRRSEVKIEYMAHHDSLTGLANRVLLNERLEHAISLIDRKEMVAVHHLDLDQFKAVNDTFGHPVGDKLLQMVADRLRGLVRETDTIARMGGDEFVIVQPFIADPADATALAQRIITLMSEPYSIDGHQAVIGASIGIAVGPGDGSGADKLLRNADLALYRAKGDGRGTFRFFEPAMDLQMQTRRIMEQDLRKALPAGEFELYYQPVVNLADGEISGFEADPLESSGTWISFSCRIHSVGGRDRLYRPVGRVGNPASMCHRSPMAGTSPCRRQYFSGSIPQSRPDAGHRWGTRCLGPGPDTAGDRNYRDRPAAQQGRDTCRASPVASTWHPDRDGRFWHRIFLAHLSPVLSVRQDQD